RERPSRCSSNGFSLKPEPMTTSTPTTRILAIGTINPGTDQAKVLAILPNEVRETSTFIGMARSTSGTRCNIVGVSHSSLMVTGPATAHEMLENLPLGRAHLMSFELISLGPLNPRRQLSGMTAKP